jgi:hypothetical protein
LRIKSQKDFWSGLMFVVTGVGFAVGALNYSFGSSARPGPAYFPFGLGALLGVLGVFIVVKSLLAGGRDGDPVGSIAWRPLAIIVGAVALFGLLLPRLGMFVSLPLLVITAALAGDEFKWMEAIVSALVLTAFSWVIFIYGLSLTIPLYPSFLGR